MSRKRSRKHDNVIQLQQALLMNGRAIEEGPKRKHWTKHDLKCITPLTPAQREMMHDFIAGKQICASGSAGSGKTFIALFLALNEMLQPESEYNRIIIVRSAVQSRDLGFMPGSLEEKTALYEQPYRDMFAELLGRAASYDDMKTAGWVEFATTSFLRGLTWDNTIVVVDETQNMNFHEINTIMTRLGQNSRILFAGDLPQTDLRRSKNDCSGMDQLIRIAGKMQEFTVVKFTFQDIVRGPLVKSWIAACEEL